MNQQQLIFIREIARTGTIRGAAACVDRTPSALTRGLKSVENELGCQLFRRIREGMVPTSEGETVLSYGERILKSLQEIKEKRIWSEMRSVIFYVSGKIRVLPGQRKLFLLPSLP